MFGDELPWSAGRPEDWKAALPGWCETLIAQAGRVFQNRLRDDMKLLLDRLFIMRDAREPVELQRSGTYTELLQQMTVPGRKQVMHALVQTFPNESHYLGHYGRLLSYDSRDFQGALSALDRAISLAPSDPQLHHMRGMVFRNEIKSVIENRTRSHGDIRTREGRILELVESARGSFDKATDLDDSSEYGHIALAQMCINVIEFRFSQSGVATYSEFLARHSAGVYRALLEEAENALDGAGNPRLGPTLLPGGGGGGRTAEALHTWRSQDSPRRVQRPTASPAGDRSWFRGRSGCERPARGPRGSMATGTPSARRSPPRTRRRDSRDQRQ
ncbi:hypothetical protein [Streptomyces sp. NPDC006638]|uniref:tetratricopeptide repeat protein n=1 Tax=Streptomyces sp. NPDC006638 TaxID=3157183 RepID=UPI0033AAAC0C